MIELERETAARCPACDAELELPYLCRGCGELLRPPPGLSHFARLGLAPAFDLDPDALEAAYFDLSRRLHPDRMLSKGPKAQARALTLSSALNESYAALKDERLRAEHLLVLHGGKTAEEDKRTPAAFLMEMMELREEVEAAQAAGDAAALEAFAARAAEERAACLARVRALFARDEFPTDELRDAIREQLNLVKYWVTLADDLRGASR